MTHLCFLIEGNTSLVTQCLNSLAFGNLLDMISEYKPDSLIMVLFEKSFPDHSSEVFPFWEKPLYSRTFRSSESTCTLIALFELLYPSASATSLPTNQGSPFCSTILNLPNSVILNLMYQCKTFSYVQIAPS